MLESVPEVGDGRRVARAACHPFPTWSAGTGGLSVPTSLPGSAPRAPDKLFVPVLRAKSWGVEGKGRGRGRVWGAGCYLFQAAGLFLLVLLHELFQRVLQPGERGDRPVEGRDVDLVDSFGVRGR